MNRTVVRPRARTALALALLVGPLSAARTRAWAEDGETIVIIDAAPDHAARDRARVLGDAPFVTILHADDHPATSSVADALATTAGVQTRSLGGLGAYQSVSVRGAAPGHTAVLVDGVPLARIAAVTTDLGRYSLAAFGTVELYRGAVPIELGGAGIGGAVNLVTRLGRGERGERLQLSAGMGSFGARHLRAHHGDEHGALRSSTTIGYQAATGDYTYFSDNGTLLNASDDAYLVRGNNGFAQVDASSRLGRADGSAAGGLRLMWKRQGLPGSTAFPTQVASLASLGVIGDVQGERPLGSAVARQLGYLMVERQGLADPLGELGFGAADRRYLTISGGASTTWHQPLGAHQLIVGAEGRGDRFLDRDLTGVQAPLTGTRVGGALSAAADLTLGEELTLMPAIRLDAMRSAPTPMTSGPMALVEVAPRWDVIPSPRVSARLTATTDLSLKGSVGWYARLPTLLEVFGNRGYLVGTPTLRAERGPSADVGLVWAPVRSLGIVDRVLVQTDVFAQRARDTIAIITTAGFSARAANIGSTHAYGGELIASARLARTLSLTASYTRLLTAQESTDESLDGRAIPRRPPHLLYGRADVERRVLGHLTGVWLDGTWQAASYLDQANLGRVPGRLLVGAGARVELGAGFGLAGTIANLTDARIARLPLDPAPSPTLMDTPTPLTDVAGFPLPGRSFYLSLDWSH